MTLLSREARETWAVGILGIVCSHSVAIKPWAGDLEKGRKAKWGKA